MKDALETLKGKPKVKRTMWSRRAQEYEAKINSGDLTSIAEVTRDLFRPDDAPEQSYSERQIFEAASSRLARELGAMEQTDEKSALAKILEILNKAAPIHHKAKEAGLSLGSSAGYAKGRPHRAPFFLRLPRISRCCIAKLTQRNRRSSMRKSIAAAVIAAAAADRLPAATTAARTAGPTVSRNYQVGNFQQIEVAGPYDVEVRTGANPGVSAAGRKSCSSARWSR